MSSQGWRKNTSITRKVTEAPFDYPFFQAVRLLERSAVLEKAATQSNIATYPVAGFTPPSTESIRFSTHQSLTFPSSEVEHIDRIENPGGTSQWHIAVNMMGLSGTMGVLPFHYTELILNREKQKDFSLEHFLNLFNHRTLSLFFQASIKYKLALQYERHQLYHTDKQEKDSATQALLSMIGLGTEGLNHRLYTRDESLLYYSGLFSQRVRTSTGLQQVLRSHFNIPVKIEQFVGQWQDLIEDVRTKLVDLVNPTGRNACLGRNAMLGKKGWFAQGKIHIILGPLNKAQLQQFAPGTTTLKAFNEMVRMYVNMENDYDFIIRIKKSDIPERIQLNRTSPPILGWNAWLSKKSAGFSDSKTTMDITVSASRFQ